MTQRDQNQNLDSSEFTHLRHESPEFIFNLSQSHFQKGEFQQSYDILHLLALRSTLIPNLHYNLAKCAQKLENEGLMKTHLKKELATFDNLAAFNLLERLEVRQNIPYLTFFIALISIILYVVFFQNITQLDLYRYALHIDNISFTAAITSFFFHSSYLHLGTNILLLLVIGSFLEKFLSKIQYLLIFFLSGIVANIIQVVMYAQFNQELTVVIGMSGSIFALLAVVLFRAPLLSIPIKLGNHKCNLSLLAVILIIYVLSIVSINYTLNVAHYSHLFGFLIGCAIAAFSSEFLRSRFYPLLIFIFGVLLFTNPLLNQAPFLGFQIIDFITAVGLIMYSYAFLLKKENYLRGIEE